jgi:hypothetical protein
LLNVYSVVVFVKDAYTFYGWHDFEFHEATSKRPSTSTLSFFFLHLASLLANTHSRS